MPFSNADSVFHNYKRKISCFDNLLDDQNNIRPEVKTLFDKLNTFNNSELQDRKFGIQRLLQENGVTYNVYGDPEGSYRTWNLDPFPLIINSNEWNFIEKGLIQRAKVLNFILDDIYTNRNLIKNNDLPLDLIYNHDGFLRQCDNIKSKNGVPLFNYAADLVKDKNGKLWISSDRTQAPSGSGYALENRSVLMQVIPEIFQGYEIRNIKGFFNKFHESLAAQSPEKINPRIVILTPGTKNETYFEHAFLSSHFGYHLVQGEDLTVRNGFVWIKTIRGLEKVDIILRRVDDRYMDPLELYPESQLGIPGLLDVIREGNVVVVNPLGSSIIENSGIMAFLPAITRKYFNEELLIPSIDTWWCGNKQDLNHVLENLDYVTIKLIHRKSSNRTISDGNLSGEEKSEIIKKLLSKPGMYVAHARPELSTTPCFVDGIAEYRHTSLRCFLVSEGKEYNVMPGGLARSAAQKDSVNVSNQFGGISKDTWILSENEYATLFLSKSLKKSLFSPNKILSSRTAENMFWAGRYYSRAIFNARYLQCVINKLNENFHSTIQKQKLSLVLLPSLTHLLKVYPGFTGSDAEKKYKEPEKEFLNILLSNKNSGTLACTFDFFKRSVFSVRSNLPLDSWQIIEGIEAARKKIDGNVWKIRPVQKSLKKIISFLSSFSGICMENIPKDVASAFFNTGRHIEKSLLIISLIRSSFYTPQEETVEYEIIETMLKANMNLMYYRSRFRTHLQLDGMLNIILLDKTNPSSLVYQLEEIHRFIQEFIVQNTSNSKNEKLSADAVSIVNQINIPRLLSLDSKSLQRNYLDETLLQISTILLELSDSLSSDYFTHSETSTSLQLPKKLIEL